MSMRKQSDVFLGGEGAAWLERNKDKLPINNDPVMAAIETAEIQPKKVLEVGCANGWRLRELKKRFKCVTSGVDPGVTHLHFAEKDVLLSKGVASDLSRFRGNSFDMVIYGFCLYLCDPEDYFKIAMEGDRVLMDGGHLVVYDFELDAFRYPHSRPYEHKEGIFSHHMRFSRLWRSHPAYRGIAEEFHGTGADMTVVTILKKNMHDAFPVDA